jgi:hypothetical protein
MERIRSYLNYANVMATIAVLFAMSGGAIAATGGFSSGGKLRACVTNEGRLKLVTSGESCKRGQKSVSWSQTGPAGAKGASGAPGAPGVAGAKGADGQNGAPAVSLWARVGKGTLEASNGVTNFKTEASGTAAQVTFNRDIRSCGVQATVNGGPATGVLASSTEGETSNTAVVLTFDEKGLALGSFTVSIVC